MKEMLNFSSQLIHWFHIHGRHDLPWQKKPTPYRVWVSEVMLQQTQVATVIGYYQHFMQSFPTVEKLAEATEDAVLHHWSGLGYYARARNLHKAAQLIASKHNGVFPSTVGALVELPGIGESTAGAILSFAFNQPTPICDGNVKRVLSRIFAIDSPKQKTATNKLLWELAAKLTPKKNTAYYNQAIMDLGSGTCTRTKPKCDTCPVANLCKAHALQTPTAFPISAPKKAKPKRNTTMLLIENQHGEFLIEKRPQSGIWGGLWSFPEQTDALSSQSLTDMGFTLHQSTQLAPFKHEFTHYQLTVQPLHLKINTLHAQMPIEATHQWHDLNKQPPGGVSSVFKKIKAALLS